jgi:hypothetical protein
MENDGNIKRLPNGRKKLYVLKSEGKEKLNVIRSYIGELQKVIGEIMR